MLVQKIAHEADDLRAAQRVVGAGAARAVRLRDDIGAVEGVVEASPARIGGIQGVARIVDGHHQLRAGERARSRGRHWRW